MQMVIFIIAPTLIFLGVLAEPTFIFLFTEKWAPAIPYFQILCIIGVFQPVQNYNLNILKVKGRSDLLLKLEVIKKIIISVTILITIPFGIIALLYGQVAVTIISFFINSYYSGKFIGYTSWEQIKDLAPIIIVGLISGIGVFIIDFYINFEQTQVLMRLVLGVLSGSAIYLVLSYVFKIKALKDLSKILMKR